MSWLLVFTACTETEYPLTAPQEEISQPSLEKIGYLHFSSSDALRNSLMMMAQNPSLKRVGASTETSTAVSGGEFMSLMTPLDTAKAIIATVDDDVITYEADNSGINSQKELIEDGNLSVYFALGYDTIVPDTMFARLLNIKGEIQVGDTIYKVSPRGTYYFLANLEKHFTENYPIYEKTDGILIAENLYLIDDAGIYRYATFDNNQTTDCEGDNLDDDVNDCQMTPYTDLSNPFAKEVDWSILPKEKSNAKTIFGKIWQGIFGCNKGFHYKIAKKRRVTGKLFYYNYLIYNCTGASVKMEKKNWIGWSGTKADKLTIDWKNVIIETTYPNDPPYKKSASPIISNIEDLNIPGFSTKVPTLSVLGLELGKSEINQITGMTAKELYSWLKRTLRKDIPGNARAYMIYGPKKVITIIPNGFKNAVNEKSCHAIFNEGWHFTISFTFNNNSADWSKTIKSLIDTQLKTPKLLKAEVRVAACLDNKWGGMTITKE